MVLNERFPIINQLIQWEQGVDPNKKNYFRCYAELQGSLFSGEGANKKLAKQVMAERAIQGLLGPRELLGISRPPQDVTVKADEPKDPAQIMAAAASLPPILRLNALCETKGKDMKPQVEFEPISEPGAKVHEQQVRCVMQIGDKKFIADARGKKQAKINAAKQALQHLFMIPAEELDRQDFKPTDLVSPTEMPPEKNPPQFLHELLSKKSLHGNWTVATEDGKSAGPQSKFVAIFQVNDQSFSGIGSSKKEAKMVCACEALQQMFQITVDPATFASANESTQRSPKKKGLNLDSFTKCPAELKAPPQLLNELCVLQRQLVSGDKSTKGVAEYTFVEETVIDRTRIYVMKVKVGEQEFTGTGTSKKMAKTQAAREALRRLFDVETPDMTLKQQQQHQQRLGPPEFGTSGQQSYSQFSVATVGDLTAALVRKKYLELCTEHGLTPTCYLAGFVITTGSSNDGYVVSLGTGARHLQWASGLSNGLTLFDCHAEILARRGLLLFFYQQLSMLADPLMANMSVFQPREGSQGYKLKDNVKIHMFSTLPPPGDARVKSASGDETQKGASADKRDESVLRCYAPTGGSIPTGTLQKVTQSWEAIRDGKERLQIMSVSDKILKWNALGIQGALLSHYVEPIYLETIVIGSGFHREPVLRAIFGRMVAHIPDATSLPQPTLAGVADAERIAARPRLPDDAALWTSAAPGIELVAQATGRDLTGKPSRVCKQYLFEQFGKLQGRLAPILKTKTQQWRKYSEAKQLAVAYKTAERELQDRLKRGGLGDWMNKPAELEDFELPWCD